MTLHEALTAAEMLKKEGMPALPPAGSSVSGGHFLYSCLHLILSPIGKSIRVIDPFTIKPLDAATVLASARATGGQIITVEDHYKEGRPMRFTVSNH